MTSEEEKKIAQWSKTLQNSIPIDLILTGDHRSDAFLDFCNNLSRIASSVLVKTDKEDLSEPPVIRVGNVTYQAIPTGSELEPFLKLLSGLNSDAAQLPLPVQSKLVKIQIPAPLKIYITPFCPFCPATVTQLLCLASVTESVKLTVIDGVMFPEAAKSDRIQSAPTVVLDDQYRWTGSIQLAEIVDMILNRDPSRLSVSSLKDMCAEGNAARVAEMMLDRAKIFPAFPELLVHAKWPVRLGAMVAFETIAAQNSQLAAQAIPFLWQHFRKANDTIKGDILYLMGVSGSKEIIPQIEAVVNGSYHSEVKEAAAEALEELRQEPR